MFYHFWQYLVIPIKNRWSIIFDWLVGKQSFFFDHGILIIDFGSFNFEMIKWLIFFYFSLIFFLFFFYQWICYVARYNIGKANRKISLSFDWSINQFFDLFQPISQIFRFFKMIDHQLKSIKKLSVIGITSSTVYLTATFSRSIMIEYSLNIHVDWRTRFTKNLEFHHFSLARQYSYLQKSQWAHMSISSRSGTREFVTIPLHQNISIMAIFWVL